MDCSVPLTHHDTRDLGLICLLKQHKIRFSDLRIQSWILLKKHTLIDWLIDCWRVHCMLACLLPCLINWGIRQMIYCFLCLYFIHWHIDRQQKSIYFYHMLLFTLTYLFISSRVSWKLGIYWRPQEALVGALVLFEACAVEVLTW